MASTTDLVAIDEMVTAKFADAPPDLIVGQPSLATVRLLVEQLAPIASGLATTQWGGRHGHLKMILGGAKYRAVLGDATVATDAIPRPGNAPAIAPGADASARAHATASHKILWREYFLQQAVDAVGVTTITKAVDEQYVAALKQDYVGFTGVTITQMLAHLRTWYKITSGQKLAIKARFQAPWNETPDAHVTTYARQLDRRQAECLELDVVITDDDKILHFVGQMIDSDVFDRKFTDDWEDDAAVGWRATTQHFADEFDKIGRARARAAERAGGDYSSAAALTQPPPARPAPAPPAPDPSAAYSAMSDYAAALELRVDELERSDVHSLPSVVSATTDTASAVTMPAPSNDLAEMKALTASLVAANTRQQKQLAAALARLDAGGGGGSGGGSGGSGGGARGGEPRRGKPREKHVCVNCNRLVWHADAKCMELDTNAHLRYEGWKSCLK